MWTMSLVHPYRVGTPGLPTERRSVRYNKCTCQSGKLGALLGRTQMRAGKTHDGLTMHVVAGTHAVLLGFDLADPAGCLGFAVHRTDHTEGEAYWLRGMKSFPSVVPTPAPGMSFSLRDDPVQAFQWGDYTAKPEHRYTYMVVAVGGAATNLVDLATVSVDIETEVEDDGAHGIWFNRGVAGSQAFIQHFGQYRPPKDAAEDHPAFAWLSRGLGEAFRRFVAQATGPEWGLRGAFYEFTWQTGLEALAQARADNADVALVVHGRDRDKPGAIQNADTTAEDNHAAVTAAGLDPAVTWRTAPSNSALQHNKFLVLTHNTKPVAVWTGSTNLTQGAVFGHSNVGHLIHDAATAQQFLDYWERLADAACDTPALKAWTHANNPVDVAAAQPPAGITAIFSPRTGTSLLDWYAKLFDSATRSAHITGAFGLNKVFRDKLDVDHDVVRTVLLDKKPSASQAIPTIDPDVRAAWGSLLTKTTLDRWAERLTGFNSYVKYIHTKIILLNPLSPSPTTITGSANYSDNSTSLHEENTVIISGDRDPGAQRVADIYLTEYQRLFQHFLFRDLAHALSTSNTAGRLLEDSSWTNPYYTPGSWRERQRRTFADTG
jgi:phosphatidylserine/phosphatidylglycerophosphate/cardiolipin synthase-like enzyme